MFLVAAAVAVLGGTFFNVFVSGEQQPWNDLKANSNKVHCYSNKGAEIERNIETDDQNNATDVTSNH